MAARKAYLYRGSQAGLGRQIILDPNDAKYPLRAPVPLAPVESKYWLSVGKTLDQGSTSQCVAYAWTRFLTTHPIVNAKPHLPPAVIYQMAQRIDEWPGENYDGTSVRAGAKVLQAAGYLSEYRWAHDVEQVWQHVLMHGPVVMGTDWHRDMFMPDRNGFIQPTGRIDGGHAWLIIGGNRAKKNPLFPDDNSGAFRLINSWGDNWGQKGKAWILGSDLQKLIERHGEACVGVEIKRVIQ